MFGRNLFLFEHPEDNIGGAVDPPADEQAVADAPSDLEQQGAAEATPDEWSGVSREEWENAQQFISAATPFLQNLAQDYQARQQAEQASAQQAQQAALPTWDPFDENVVQQHFEARVSQAVEAALGPYQGLLGQVAANESQRAAETALEQLGSNVGSFDRDAALLIAAPMIDAGQAADTSLRAAAQYMHDLEDRIRADERQSVTAQFEELKTAGADGANGATPGATATEFDKIPTGPRRYHEAIERAIQRRQAGFPVG